MFLVSAQVDNAPGKFDLPAGMAWALQRRPGRLQATYRQLQGAEQFLGFYDVHADYFSFIFRKRKGLTEISAGARRRNSSSSSQGLG